MCIYHIYNVYILFSQLPFKVAAPSTDNAQMIARPLQLNSAHFEAYQEAIDAYFGRRSGKEFLLGTD